MTTAEKIAIMQAFVDGKQIQFRKKYTEEEWKDFHKNSNPIWNWFDIDYRIEPEPKAPAYRPYKDFEEFVADWDKHGGWVFSKPSERFFCITAFSMDDVYALENYTWADDGSPCGVLVEEGGEV